MTTDLYSEQAQARRDKFNNIMNKIDMVLMNKIPEVDDSVWDNFQSDYNFMGSECDIDTDDDITKDDGTLVHYCREHEEYTKDLYECEKYEPESEVYQWFAINPSDAEYLKDHNQYITYSNLLDTYFLAITHFGTSWDYTSMVDDILGDGNPIKDN